MSLEGLRAWIGEVERKLGMRTRVFLALAAIAVGVGGAAIYLAIDARESSVSESDVQALQEELEARIDGLAAPTAAPFAEPEPGGESDGGAGGGTEDGPAGPAGEAGGEQPDGADSQAGNGLGSPPADVPGSASDAEKLQELLQRAKERAEENE